jgi:hypothetical protein
MNNCLLREMDTACNARGKLAMWRANAFAIIPVRGQRQHNRDKQQCEHQHAKAHKNHSLWVRYVVSAKRRES